MGAGARFLLLSAMLLTLPAITATQPSTLLVQRVWTQDAGGNEKTTFAPGETIQLAARLKNLYGKAIPSAKLKITTGFYNDTKTVDIPVGVSIWTWNTTAPSGQGYTVTIQAYDRFTGALAVGSRGFNVRESASSLREDRYAPSQFDIPETLGGYPVLAVLTENNTPCMKPGDKRLILQSAELWTEDVPHAFPQETIEEELQALGLPKYKRPGFSIIGPGVTREQLVTQLEHSYRFHKMHDCPTFELPTSTEFEAGSSPGFLRILNLDADQYPDNNGQSVILTAPNVGSLNLLCFQAHAGFLNNGVTDKRYFLQVGFGFFADVFSHKPPWPHGEVIWAAGKLGDPMPGIKFSNLKYNAGHRYYTTIAYTNKIWWTCASDLEDQATYECVDHKNAEGTHLVTHRGTSVFAENWNESDCWKDGFDQEWIASDAKIYRNGVGQPWSFEYKRLDEACETGNYDTKNTYEGAFDGHLTGGNTAKFKIKELPLWCNYGLESGRPVITKVEFPSSIVGDHHNEPGKVYFRDNNAGVILGDFKIKDTCGGCMKNFSVDAREVANYKEGWVNFYMWCETETGHSWTTEITLTDADGVNPDDEDKEKVQSTPYILPEVQCTPVSGGGL